MIKPATGIVASDFDRDAAMSAETQLLWAGKVSVRISAKVTCQIGDASIQGRCHILIIREYEGVQHVVTVRADDFEYEGRPYQSLSAIARHITGTRWNGWVFFGLKSGAHA